MATSEAQKRARDKWLDAQDQIKFRVPKGKKEKIQAFAKENGETLTAFLNRILECELNKNR